MNSNPKRVVITGLGVVAPNGLGKKEFWDNLIQGKSAVRPITRFDTEDHPSKIAAEIDGFRAEDYIEKRQVRRTDISTHYAMGAATMALADAGLDPDQEDPERVGVVIGMAAFGLDYTEKQFEIRQNSGITSTSTFTTIGVFAASAIGQLSIQYGFKGYNNLISTGCTAGTVAIGNAYIAIKHGYADIILAGGTEAPLTPLTVYSFSAMKALSTRNHEPERASRPFDGERDGFVISEGSGIVIMEELEHALQRKAPIYAEVIGYATTCNAYHMTAPEPDGTQSARAIKTALQEAGVGPADLDCIQAHGSSTPLNGKAETVTYKKALGSHAYDIPITSIKSMIGHPLGSAGAFQMVANCLSIQHGIIPPTINQERPDPDCDLDYTPNKARNKKVNIALQNSCGFSGVNAVLVIRKYR